MKWMIRCHLWRTTDFSRASSDLKPLPTERLPTRLADECERAAAKAPRRSVEDRGHEFLCTARGRWPPRREVGGGRSGVCGQRRPARSHDRGPRRDGGEKGSARFFWALQGCSTELFLDREKSNSNKISRGRADRCHGAPTIMVRNDHKRSLPSLRAPESRLRQGEVDVMRI